VVVGAYTKPSINHEYNDISFCNCLLSLPGHFVQDTGLGNWFEPTSINDDKRFLPDTALAVMTIAR
jgi:hypothetical protein